MAIPQALELAVEHHRCGRLAEAEALYRQVLSQQPNHSEALRLLGLLARRAGRPEVAVELISRAIAVDPLRAEAHSNPGNALLAMGRLDEAVAAHERALALDPQYAEAQTNLGNCYFDQGQIDRALEHYRRAMELEPRAANLHDNFIYALAFHPGYAAEEILKECRRWDKLHARLFKNDWRAHNNEASLGRRLRIGYVSPDFAHHIVGHHLLPVLRGHDRLQFEVFCYSSVPRPDDVTAQCRASSDAWREILGIPDDEAAAVIRADRIDILIDLSLHSAGNRLLVFARKPAPVAVTYLGYCGTTGVEAIAYRLSDPYLDPHESENGGYSEETVRLSRTYWCYQPSGPVPEAIPPPTLAAGYVTFGCLNKFPKVSGAALDLWMEILMEVPKSRLLLHAPAGSCRAIIRRRFSQRQIDLERLDFIGMQSWPEYIRTYERIDIALDPFPFGGGITTCDALWMGVPVVTLAGGTAVGRGGQSVLSNLGLLEMIAHTPAEYMRVARSLADDRPKLRALRSSLRRRVEHSPLRDLTTFVTDLEAAYRSMWHTWCGSQV